jgi:hypothetical protein
LNDKDITPEVPMQIEINKLKKLDRNKGKVGDQKESSKQYYNDAWDGVEWFNDSRNTEDWGFGNTEIEHELI